MSTNMWFLMTRQHKIICHIYLDFMQETKWGMGKLNQTDGYKRLLKWGIYIGATACKNLDPPQYPEG